MRYQYRFLSGLIVLMLFALYTSGKDFKRFNYNSQKSKEERAMEFKIPESLKSEHVELHEQLALAIKAGGKTGEAARAVEEVLHPHFLKEEEYALPPLGLLSSLAEGNVKPEMRTVIAMTDRLKADLPHMLEEHKAVVAALEKLSAAAKEEGKPEHLRFAETLMMHARNEEEVLYPAAILVGEYVKMKLGGVR
jgi:hemerythrin HHE cation binding domain-containing protein